MTKRSGVLVIVLSVVAWLLAGRPSVLNAELVTQEPVERTTPSPGELIHLTPQCIENGEWLTCTDNVLHLSFSYPTTWGEVTAVLSEGGYSGFAYSYNFSDSAPSSPRAGGRSADASAGRGRIATDFFGFRDQFVTTCRTSEHCFTSQEMCEGVEGRHTQCAVVKPGVVVKLFFPGASDVCAARAHGLPNSGLTGSSQGAVFVNLPEPSLINGFVFITQMLSPEQSGAVLSPVRSGDALRVEDCSAEAQAQSDAKVQALIEQVAEGTADPDIMRRINNLYRLAESIDGVGVGENQIRPTVANRAANLRSGPGLEHDGVGGVGAGDSLDVVAITATRDWYQLTNGAWIFSALVDNAPIGLPVARDMPASPLATPTLRPLIPPHTLAD